MQIDLDIKKSIEENASVYFEKAKKAKKKIEGAETALGKARIELVKLEKKQEIEKQEFEKQDALKVVDRKTNWYEKFRWFKTTDGLLAIGGRDATTNEIVVKKHTLAHDIVFHTDMAGSPFFVLQTEGREDVPEEVLCEVADAVCSFSKAWKLGLGSQRVFYVKPEQVTKEAQSGEYIPKGAFMIKGKTNYIDNEINIAMGMCEDGSIMAGPLKAVEVHCKNHVVLEQGNDKASHIAKKIQRVIGGSVDDIIRAMPSGGCQLKK